MDQTVNYHTVFEEELKRLNAAQLQAVEHTDGPVLVVAGPGTGKTQVIAARIGYILSSPNIQVYPQNILCLTYTESGAIAMRKRLVQLIGPEAYKLHIYTFHGFCNRVIQQNPDLFGIKTLQPVSDLELVSIYKQLIDSFDAKNPLKRFYGDVYYDKDRLKNLFSLMKTENWSAEYILSEIANYNQSLPTRDEYIYKRAQGIYKKGDVKQHAIDAELEKMKKIEAASNAFDVFEQLMRESGRYDYDDMIQWVIKAFKQHESVLYRYKEQYLYYLVDEFQDTNGAQQEILNLLTEDIDANPNLFVVGDDDQSIYRFQGANLKNFVQFIRAYKQNLFSVVLNENYRSAPSIIEAAQTLIAESQERLSDFIEKEKKLSATCLDSVDSPPVQLIEYRTTVEEETDIINQIEKLYRDGENLNDIAIIYRQHKLVENIVKVLEQKGIPLAIKQRINVLHIPIIQKIIQILKYLSEESRLPHSAELILFELLHYPFFNIDIRDSATLSWHSHKIKETTWRELIANKEKLFQLGLVSASSISKFEKNISQWIQDVKNLPIQRLVEKVLTESGILQHILISSEKTWLLQAVMTWYEFLKEENLKNSSLSLHEFLRLLEDIEKNNLTIPFIKSIGSDQGVHFVTAHSSKGLEFKHVFVFSCTTSIWELKTSPTNQLFKLPDSLVPSVEEEKVEEERRLLYVAMTRAKESLRLSYARQDKNGKELEPSRFIAEILKNNRFNVTYKSIDEDVLIDHYVQLLNYTPSLQTDELLDHQLIEDALSNYKMNITHLNKYLRCPLTFYFEHIVHVPMAKNEYMGFGSAVHFALERLFKTMQEDEGHVFPSVEQFYHFFEQGMRRVRFSFTDDEFKRRLDYGKELLPAYYQNYSKSWKKINVLEYRINTAEIEGVPITGILDKLEFDGKKVNVVDYKTGDPEKGLKKLAKPSIHDPLGGDYWRQMVFYKILLDSEKYKGWEMLTGEIDFIQKNKKNEFIKEKLIVQPEDILIVQSQIKETYQKIKNHEFATGCGKEDCTWCNFVKTLKQ